MLDSNQIYGFFLRKYLYEKLTYGILLSDFFKKYHFIIEKYLILSFNTYLLWYKEYHNNLEIIYHDTFYGKIPMDLNYEPVEFIVLETEDDYAVYSFFWRLEQCSYKNSIRWVIRSKIPISSEVWFQPFRRWSHLAFGFNFIGCALNNQGCFAPLLAQKLNAISYSKGKVITAIFLKASLVMSILLNEIY